MVRIEKNVKEKEDTVVWNETKEVELFSTNFIHIYSNLSKMIQKGR